MAKEKEKEAGENEDRRKDSVKTQADSWQEADEEEDNFLEYSGSDFLLLKSNKEEQKERIFLSELTYKGAGIW